MLMDMWKRQDGEREKQEHTCESLRDTHVKHAGIHT